ncbi:MAG: beta strand repeat-containing protein, partial [Ignavibacteria bacterium]
GAFTTLNASGATSLGSTLGVTGLSTFTGGFITSAADINGGSIDGTPIGATATSTGAFTTLDASGATQLTSTLSVTGLASFNGGANVTGNLSVLGAGNDLSVADNISSSTAVFGGGGLVVGTVLTANGNIAVAGAGNDLDVNDDITLGDDLTAGGTIQAAAGLVATAGGLDVLGDSYINRTGTNATELGNAAGPSSTIVRGPFSVTGTTFTISAGTTTTFNNDVTLSGAGTDLTVGNNITSSGGNIVADDNITSNTGNIAATIGSVSAGTSMSAGTTIGATGTITSSAGDIVATTGQVRAGSTMTAATGITSSTGDIVATTGQVRAGTSMLAGTTITATTGITSTTGNIVATAGEVRAGTGLVANAGGVDFTGKLKSNVISTNNNTNINPANAAVFIWNGAANTLNSSLFTAGSAGTIIFIIASAANQDNFYGTLDLVAGQAVCLVHDGTSWIPVNVNP